MFFFLVHCLTGFTTNFTALFSRLVCVVPNQAKGSLSQWLKHRNSIQQVWFESSESEFTGLVLQSSQAKVRVHGFLDRDNVSSSKREINVMNTNNQGRKSNIFQQDKSWGGGHCYYNTTASPQLNQALCHPIFPQEIHQHAYNHHFKSENFTK